MNTMILTLKRHALRTLTFTNYSKILTYKIHGSNYMHDTTKEFFDITNNNKHETQTRTSSTTANSTTSTTVLVLLLCKVVHFFCVVVMLPTK